MGYILKHDQPEILRRLVSKAESRFSSRIQSLSQIHYSEENTAKIAKIRILWYLTILKRRIPRSRRSSKKADIGKMRVMWHSMLLRPSR